MRTLIISVSLLTAACTPEVTQDTLALQVPMDNRREPAITLEAPPVVEPGTMTQLAGRATDADQPDQTLIVELSSAQDGPLWRGNPNSEGDFFWEGQLSDGLHLLTAVSTDAAGVKVVARSSTWVGEVQGADRPPVCAIRDLNSETSAPSNVLELNAWARDDVTVASDLTYAWFVDGEGPVVLGNHLLYVVDTDEEVLVRLEVEDQRGQRCTQEMVQRVIVD